MHPNDELVTRFHDAFQRRDADAMAACHHPDIDAVRGHGAKGLDQLGQKKPAG